MPAIITSWILLVWKVPGQPCQDGWTEYFRGLFQEITGSIAFGQAEPYLDSWTHHTLKPHPTGEIETNKMSQQVSLISYNNFISVFCVIVASFKLTICVLVLTLDCIDELSFWTEAK